MTAELDVSVSSQQAVTGVNELRKVFQQLIDSVNKVDATLATGQQQIDKLGSEFTSSASEIKASVAEISGSMQRATADINKHGKAQEESISRASRYIAKLQQQIQIEEHALEKNKELGVASAEGARQKAVFAAQILKNVAAMSAEGQQIDTHIRKLMGLQQANEGLVAKQALADKREAFTTSLKQEADILERVNARASELRVKVSELAAYKQFLAQATRLNIDLNGQEFASLQKLYLAKEEQIRLGKNIGISQGGGGTTSRNTVERNISMASSPAALDLEVAKTGQLVSIYSQYSGNTAELAIQKEILNRKIAAGNSLSDIEIARIEKRIRAIYQNKEAVNQLVMEEERRQKVSGTMGGLSSEGAQMDKLIGIYRRYGADAEKVAIQKEVLNRVTAAGGNVTAEERRNIEATVVANAKKRAELEKLEKQYGTTTAATGRFNGGLTRMQLILSGMVYMGLNRAVSSVSDFYTNLSIANAVTEASTGEMMQLEAAARKLGETTVFTAGEAANGIQFLGQAGMNVENILKTLPDTLNLASAGSIDLGRAADIATNMMASFGLQAGQMGEAADIIAYTAAKSNTNVEQLAEGMKYAGPAAKAAGLSLGETAAIIGTLSNSGIQASMSGTSLRQALVQLSKEPTQNATKALKELGLTFDDVSLKNNTFEQAIGKLASRGMNLGQAAAIFDTRAATAMLALADLIPVWDRLNEGIDGAAGTAERMARIRLANLTGDFRLLAGATGELILTLGDAGFLRVTRQLVTDSKDTLLWITKWVKAWNELWAPIETSTETIKEYSQAANGALKITNESTQAIKNFKTAWIGDSEVLRATHEVMIGLAEQAGSLASALIVVTGLKLGGWALNAATGFTALAAEAGGYAALLSGIATAQVGVFGWLVAAGYVAKLGYDMWTLHDETGQAVEQMTKMNTQLETMALRSKKAAEELDKLALGRYTEVMQGVNIKRQIPGETEAQTLRRVWEEVNKQIEEYEKKPSLSDAERSVNELYLEKLYNVREALGGIARQFRIAGATLSGQFDELANKTQRIMAAAQNTAFILAGAAFPGYAAFSKLPFIQGPQNDYFGLGREFKPLNDETSDAENKAKAYENFVKNLERANKEQKKLNELRKEYGDNEDLINLKLKIYNTLLEAKDIKGGISSAETKRIEKLITETAEQENLNKSVKAFIDLQREVSDNAKMAQFASTYGTDSVQYFVTKQMQEFRKANTNLMPEQYSLANEMFHKKFYDDRTIRDTKKGEKQEKSDAEKASEAYKKYISDVERDIEVTTKKMRLAEEYGKNQDLLNVKMKDYERQLRVEAELKERGLSLDEDKRQELTRLLTMQEKVKDQYDAEIERIKKVVDVHKELTNSIVGAVKEAKTFREAFIRLGDAATELLLKMAATKASESLFGKLFGNVGKAAGFATTIGPNDVAVNGTGGAFMRGSKVQAFGTGGVFTGPTIFPMANGQVGLAGERGNEVFMPAKRMMNGDVGVRVQVPTTGRGAGGVVMSNQFNIKVEGGTREQNDDAASKVSKNVEMAMRNIAYDVMMKEKSTGGMLRR